MDANEIAQEIAASPLSLEQKLEWHFANFDKPIPKSMVPVAIEAIQVANAGGDLDTILDLPTGTKFLGMSVATVQLIIEDHYLWFYLDDPDAFPRTDD
jgi:hypothetical protein